MSKWVSILGDLYNIDSFHQIKKVRPYPDREEYWEVRAYYIIRDDGVYREDEYVELAFGEYSQVSKVYDNLMEALEATEI